MIVFTRAALGQIAELTVYIYWRVSGYLNILFLVFSATDEADAAAIRYGRRVRPGRRARRDTAALRAAAAAPAAAPCTTPTHRYHNTFGIIFKLYSRT